MTKKAFGGVFSSIDVLFLLFIIAVWCSSVFSGGNFLNSYLLFLLPIYVLMRCLNNLFPKTAEVIVLLISIYALFECGLRSCQLLRTIFDGNFNTSYNGSFINSGPYGGMLALVSSLLFPYVMMADNKMIKKIASIALVFSILLLPSTFSRAAILACAVPLFLCSYKKIESFKLFVSKYRLLLLAGIALLLLGAYMIKQRSADGRLHLNKMSLRMVGSNSLFGVGIGNYSACYATTQYDYFRNKMNDDIFSNDMDKERMVADCTDDAFNDFLQIAVESGLPSMILFISLIVLSIVRSNKNGLCWGYGLISFSIFALFSYPMELLQFQVILAVLLAMCTNHSRNTPEYTFLPILVIIIALLIPSFITLVKQNKIERSWESKRKWYKREYYDIVLSDYPAYYNYLNKNGLYMFEYGRALNKTGYYEQSDSIMQMGNEVCGDPMFWNIMGNNSLALGNYREAEERYKHAFFMVPNRLYPLYLLSKLYYTEGDTARFLDMADKIESFKPKIESQTTADLRSEIRDLKNELLSESIKKDD